MNSKTMCQISRENSGTTPGGMNTISFQQVRSAPKTRPIVYKTCVVLRDKPPDPNNPAYPILDRQRELIDLVKENVKQAQAKQKRYYDQHRKSVDFQEGDVVWVRTHPLSKANEGFMAKLSAKWKGPAKIKKKLGPVNYSVSFIPDPDITVCKILRFVMAMTNPSLRGGVCNRASCY